MVEQPQANQRMRAWQKSRANVHGIQLCLKGPWRRKYQNGGWRLPWCWKISRICSHWLRRRSLIGNLAIKMKWWNERYIWSSFFIPVVRLFSYWSLMKITPCCSKSCNKILTMEIKKFVRYPFGSNFPLYLSLFWREMLLVRLVRKLELHWQWIFSRKIESILRTQDSSGDWCSKGQAIFAGDNCYNHHEDSVYHAHILSMFSSQPTCNCADEE